MANVTLKAAGSVGAAIRSTASVIKAQPPLTAGATVPIVGSVPVARDGVLETNENEAAEGVLKASGSEGAALTFIIVSQPTHGSVTLDDASSGAYTYTPATGYSGADGFSFKASDGIADSNTAKVSITVINAAPVAEDGTLTTDKNKSAKGTLKASDPNGDSLTFSIVEEPRHGTVTLEDAVSGVYVYTPNNNYAGSDGFSFDASDGHLNSNAAAVSITVHDNPPVAKDGTLNITANAVARGTLEATDPDGDTLNFSIVNQPSHGYVTMEDASTGAYTYVPEVGYSGSDSFSFKASDGMQDSNVATVSITVNSATPTQSSGGGANGPFGLVLLMLIALAALWRRRGLHEKASMSRKFLIAIALSVFILPSLFVGTLRAQTSPVAQGKAVAAAKAELRVGLTTRGISLARRSGVSVSGRVAMAPQSTLSLLSRATKVGPHAKDATIALTFGLKLHNTVRLKRFLSAVQDPHSGKYRKFLTPGEFTAAYGPTATNVDAVRKFLERWGIKVTGVSSDRLLIHTAGRTEAYENALEIRINNYRLNGRRFYSTEDSPKLPRTIAPLVVNILGLNHGLRMRPLSHYTTLGARTGAIVRVRANAPAPTPPPTTPAHFNPYQIAKAYAWPDITDASNGAGVSIAILTALAPNVAGNPDYHDFWAAYGLPDHTLNVIPIGGESGSGGGAETALDIEWSGAMAPGATLNVYVAVDAHLDTFATMYDQFVSDNDSQVMSTSWGLAEPAAPALFMTDEQIFMRAAAQGISMFAASGDHGASDCAPAYCPPGPNNADFPSSSLYVTAANGTELTTDASGNYISETAWSDTGGAISQLFEQPNWQIGLGVPRNGWRNNSDIALNAGGLHPYLLYLNGGWTTVYGTSAVAPQLAGLFAIGVSQNDGISLGQSNKLIYDDVNAGNYASDFHDVIAGCNGQMPDGTPSCAGKNWDHPTGWGSPRATNLLSHLSVQGPRGTVEGTVTVAASGATLIGAEVIASPGNRGVTTDGQGGYSLPLPTGNFTVTAHYFGYQSQSASVTITDGDTLTQDFALQPADKAILSGHVTDASGHGWGLYAEIKISTPGFGHVADVWTDPATGAYSIALPEGEEYELSIAPAFNGYVPGSATLTLAKDTTQDFPLVIENVCSAPGYSFTGGFSEGFNGNFPPTGWTIDDPIRLSPLSWNTNQYWQDDNYTGGTGNAPTVDTVNKTHRGGLFDTSLVSPAIPVTSLPAVPVLRFNLNYQHGNRDSLDVDISADGGAWLNVAHLVSNYGALYSLPGALFRKNLSGFIPAGAASIRLRWRYHGGSRFLPAQIWYAQIDNVIIGNCQPIPGGLIYGQVSDANTGDGIVGAAVTDDQGNRVHTIANPDDPNLPAGSYLLFSPSGKRSLTASYKLYQDATTNLDVTDNEVVSQDFALRVGQLVVDPDNVVVHVMVDSRKSETVTLKNTGGAAAHYRIEDDNLPFPPTGGPRAILAFSPKPAHGVGKLSRLRGGLCGDGADLASCGSLGDEKPNLVPEAGTGPGSGARAFDTGLDGTYGLGVDHDADDLWVGSISFSKAGGDDKDHQYLFNGAATGDSMDVSSLSNVGFTADMAYDDNTGMFWQVGISSSAGFCIYELDPFDKQATGGRICPNIGTYQTALAYNPLTNTWYSGDFNSDMIYQFDASGNVLGSTNVGIPVIALAYNSNSGHLFALTSGYKHNIYVLDAENNYAQLSAFDIPGLGGANDGAGLGYACNGLLWATDQVRNRIYEFRSGETGWCDFKKIPWLTEAPTSGTLDAGASVAVELAFDGDGHEEFTTSKSQFVVKSNNTPYETIAFPVTVYWDPQPVNLVLSGSANTESLKKGDGLIYSLAVKNVQAENHGTASEVELTYPLPPGVSFASAGGEGVTCTAPAGASSPAPASATSAPGMVVCDLGTLGQGASKTVTIAVQANEAGKLTSHFKVTAREPDDSGKNALDVTTTVIGAADLGVSAEAATLTAGSTGTLHLAVANAGPDPATDAKLQLSAGASVKLQSAQSGQGECALSNGGIACDLGEIAADGQVDVEVNVFGTSAGSAQLTAQATTTADDADSGNNVATAQITVKAPSTGGGNDNNGGGALDWLVLVALFGLALAAAGLRYRRAQT